MALVEWHTACSKISPTWQPRQALDPCHIRPWLSKMDPRCGSKQGSDLLAQPRTLRHPQLRELQGSAVTDGAAIRGYTAWSLWKSSLCRPGSGRGALVGPRHSWAELRHAEREA